MIPKRIFGLVAAAFMLNGFALAGECDYVPVRVPRASGWTRAVPRCSPGTIDFALELFEASGSPEIWTNIIGPRELLPDGGAAGLTIPARSISPVQATLVCSALNQAIGTTLGMRFSVPTVDQLMRASQAGLNLAANDVFARHLEFVSSSFANRADAYAVAVEAVGDHYTATQISMNRRSGSGYLRCVGVRINQ